NITRADFSRLAKGRSFTIQCIGHEIDQLNHAYGDVAPGEIAAFFNSAGVLEIAVNAGNAASLLNIRLNTIVRVIFE
ncbi:MAG TPA: SAM hydroxide adenosyltransferase, partial [Bacteroidia bacterium]|nr:SAM hydroxide adenosyltransferase [Bacteroidia bacterium]